MASEQILVATSLIPGRTDTVQQTAVASWQALGLRVMSVNADAEMGPLQRDFPNVAFVAAERTGQKIAGKPVPLIFDMLHAACVHQGSSRTIGIINADIVLRSVTALPDLIAAEIRESLILLPRVDVTATAGFQANGTETFSTGYDGFFIDADIVPDLPDSPFCLGMPFWDYWLPMVAILKRRALKTIASPVALHVAHETKWDRAIYFYFHALVGDLIALCRDNGKAGDPSLALLADVFANIYAQIFSQGTAATGDDAQRRALADLFDRIQEVIVHHIKQRAQPLTVPGA